MEINVVTMPAYDGNEKKLVGCFTFLVWPKISRSNNPNYSAKKTN